MNHLSIPHLIHKLTDDIFICCRCGQKATIIRNKVFLNGGKRTITKLVFPELSKRILSKEDRLNKLGLVLPEDIRQ